MSLKIRVIYKPFTAPRRSDFFKAPPVYGAFVVLFRFLALFAGISSYI